ncbi:MAG: hypothetical protein HOJ35_09060 [Bdellovibrionales bacterium]|jgi:hypothetical protein|nr:hypothetical protein [Bdellovibrionales bacterium]
MHLESNEIINRPLADVYKLVRDDLDKLVPYLPNIEKIEVKKHEEIPNNQIQVINHWYGKADVPSLLKKLLNPEFYSWKDNALWKDNEHCVEYELESFLANDLFDVKGINSFSSISEDKTELKISCEVLIYPEKVPGIPRLLAKKVTPMIEKMIKKLLAPNLTSLGKGINQYYAEH